MLRASFAAFALLVAGCSAPAEVELAPDCLGVANGTPCRSLDLCAERAECRAESCETVETKSCTTSAACTAAACDPETGACMTRALDGPRCDDGSECTDGDQCVAGACVGVPTGGCASRVCQVLVTCGESGCGYADAPDGTPCDDGDACTRDTTCMSGSCRRGTAVECPAPEACQVALACDPVEGCRTAPASDGALCDDGDACTDNRCVDGACTVSERVQCADLPCTISSACNPRTGFCEFEPEPDRTACDDRDRCTEGDQCVSGGCAPGTPVVDMTPTCSEGICFVEQAAARGVDFRANAVNQYAHGAPAAMFDADGDGDLDLLIGAERTVPVLYLNDGEANFTRSAEAGITVTVGQDDNLFDFAIADIEGDGDLDVLVSKTEGRNPLFVNDGRGRFTEEGLARGLSAEQPSVSADFGDFDGDGDLDLMVANYITEPSNYPSHNPTPNQLLMNDGTGRFTDVSADYGTVIGNGTTLVVRWMHLNDDNDIDLVECNDFGNLVERSRAYLNTGDDRPEFRFEERSRQLDLDLNIFCMSITPGDFDRDQDLDLYFTNIGEHRLMRNDAGVYTDVAFATGADLRDHECKVDLLSAGWSAVFGDFDQDGWPDLFSANGYIIADDRRNGRESRNSLLRNVGARFEDISVSAGVDSVAEARGASVGDLDGDGDLDLWVANMSSAPELYLNVSPEQGRWLRLDLRGADHWEALGARVMVDFGDFALTQEVSRRVGLGGQSERVLHFGAGEATTATVRIRWPSGRTQVLEDIATNQTTIVHEPR